MRNFQPIPTKTIRSFQRVSVSIIATSMLPVVAIAEVSDKMATIPQLWLQGLFVGTVAFILARYRPWWSLVAVAFSAVMLSAVADLYADPYMADAIWQEQGLPYAASSWASAAIPLLAVVLGLAFRKFSGQRS